MFIKHNENRDGRNVGDCTVRALSTALNQTWKKTCWGLCVEGAAQADMPSSNSVWGAYLKKRGFRRRSPPDDVTVGEFARRHPAGCSRQRLRRRVQRHRRVDGHVAYHSAACVLRYDAENIRAVIFWRKKAHRAFRSVRFFSCGRHVFACRSIFSTFSLDDQQTADHREREHEILPSRSVALPALDSPLRQAEFARKFRLRQPQIFPEIAH